MAQALSSDSEDDQQAKNKQKKHMGQVSSSDSEADEEQDQVNEPLAPVNHQKQVQMAQKARISVSAEVFGKYNMK